MKVGDYSGGLLSKIFTDKYWTELIVHDHPLRRHSTEKELDRIKNLKKECLLKTSIKILAETITGEVPEHEKTLSQKERLENARLELDGVLQLYTIGVKKEKVGLKPKVIIGLNANQIYLFLVAFKS